jgi:hypothetical protein
MPEIGKVTHYFDKIGVAVIDLKKELKVGDKIQFKGPSTDFTQAVESMQIDKKPIPKASKGLIALKVVQKVIAGDSVIKP